MVDIRSGPLLLGPRPTFSNLCFHGSLSQAVAATVPSAFPLHSCSSHLQLSETGCQTGRESHSAGSAPWTVSPSSITGEQVGGQQHQRDGLRLSGAKYSLLGSMRDRHVKARLPSHSAALTENKLYIPLHCVPFFSATEVIVWKEALGSYLKEASWGLGILRLCISHGISLYSPTSPFHFICFSLMAFWLVDPNDLIQPGINRMSLLLSWETFCQCLLPTFQPSVLRVCILALKTLSNLTTQWKCNYFLYEDT